MVQLQKRISSPLSHIFEDIVKVTQALTRCTSSKGWVPGIWTFHSQDKGKCTAYVLNCHVTLEELGNPMVFKSRRN